MRAAILASVLALAACGGGENAAKLPDVRLPTLAGPLGPSLATCLTDKCLTVLVAPWCGICHRVTPDIVRLRGYLAKAGVESRVVVGLAELEPIKGMAALFGSDTLLDERGAVAARGVPMFVVTNRSGDVLKRVNGFPGGLSSSQEIAAYFGLP
jgi:hypothetical protein